MNWRPCIAVLLAACQTVPDPPPYSWAAAEGVTFAHTEEAAEQYGRLADQLSRRVRTLLGVRESEPFQLRMLDHEMPGTAHAGTISWFDKDGLIIRYMRIGNERIDAAPAMIAHELTHWHIEYAWGLPLVVEEGVAEIVTLELREDGEAVEREYRQLLAANVDAPILQGTRPFEIDRGDWRRLKHEDKRLLYAFGYVVAEGIGLPTLRNMNGSTPQEFLNLVDVDG